MTEPVAARGTTTVDGMIARGEAGVGGWRPLVRTGGESRVLHTDLVEEPTEPTSARRAGLGRFNHSQVRRLVASACGEGKRGRLWFPGDNDAHVGHLRRVAELLNRAAGARAQGGVSPPGW